MSLSYKEAYIDEPSCLAVTERFGIHPVAAEDDGELDREWRGSATDKRWTRKEINQPCSSVPPSLYLKFRAMIPYAPY